MDPDDGEPSGPPAKSFGNMSDAHWSRTRAGMNEEALEHYRNRSRAPGVAEGGASRNHYCMECDGVIALEYDSRDPAAGPPTQCPHCGAELEPRVRAMFNWVEIDQVPGSDFRALLPFLVAGLVAIAAAVFLVLRYFF